jgi:phosphomannomutase/phosphoglucomutase
VASSSGRLFGTNGIRFVPGVTHDLDFVLKLAESIGTYFPQGEVLLGRDGRTSGQAISQAAAAGLMSAGRNVAEAGLVPTPALQTGVRKLGMKGGVMVTASHNPPQYNGLKVMGPEGVEIPRLDEQRIEKIFNDDAEQKADWKNVGVARSEQSIVKLYLQAVISQVNSKLISERRFTVVMDIGNGAQADAAPYLAEALGCKVITINAVVDGAFPGRGPEPTPESLKDLSAATRAVGADLGVGYDGDGDRSLFVDENGIVIWGDLSGSLIADYLLEKHPGGTIVTPVSSSQAIENVVKRRNGKVIRTRVGSVDVSRTIMERKALFGFEENGGCIYPQHLAVRDGAMTTALMLECLATRGLTLSKAISYSVPRFYQAKSKIEVPPARVPGTMRRVEKQPHVGIERVDGLKLWTDETSWVLVRPSGTEPIIRIFTEAQTPEKAEALLKKFVKLVKSAAEK